MINLRSPKQTSIRRAQGLVRLVIDEQYALKCHHRHSIHSQSFGISSLHQRSQVDSSLDSLTPHYRHSK